MTDNGYSVHYKYKNFVLLLFVVPVAFTKIKKQENKFFWKSR